MKFEDFVKECKQLLRFHPELADAIVLIWDEDLEDAEEFEPGNIYFGFWDPDSKGYPLEDKFEELGVGDSNVNSILIG